MTTHTQKTSICNGLEVFLAVLLLLSYYNYNVVFSTALWARKATRFIHFSLKPQTEPSPKPFSGQPQNSRNGRCFRAVDLVSSVGGRRLPTLYGGTVITQILHCPYCQGIDI